MIKESKDELRSKLLCKESELADCRKELNMQKANVTRRDKKIKALQGKLQEYKNMDKLTSTDIDRFNKYKEKIDRYEKNHCFTSEEAYEKIKEFGFKVVHKSLMPLPNKEKVPILMGYTIGRCNKADVNNGISWRWKYVNCPDCLRAGNRELGGRPLPTEKKEN